MARREIGGREDGGLWCTGRRRDSGFQDRPVGYRVLAMQGLGDLDRSLHKGVLELNTAPDWRVRLLVTSFEGPNSRIYEEQEKR